MALKFPKQYILGLIVSAAQRLLTQENQVFNFNPDTVHFVIESKDNPVFGDYSSNACFVLAKITKKSPLEIAEKIKVFLEAQTPEYIERIEIAGNGFLNFYLTNDFCNSWLGKISKLSSKNFASSKKEKVIIEYSSPNVAKPMHVGHIRNTILGSSLANLYEFVGHKVTRWNHLGDWGTQFGKLITAYKKWGDKKAVDKNPIGELLELYIRFHKELEKYPELEKQAQEEFKKLEQGDKTNKSLLAWILKESLKDFNRLYSLFGAKFDKTIGESFYAPMTDKIIADLKNQKLLEPSEGAWIIKLDAFGLPPALIQKTDGATLYLTREIASLYYRLSKFNPDKILYIVGSEQSLHFQQLFAIAKLLNLSKTKLEHVKYELVLGSDGKKFSTREGNIIAAQAIVDTIIQTAQKVVDEKRSDVSEKEKNVIAKTVGINALIYSMLNESRMTDIVFNPEAMLSFKGNSATYLNYTYARLSNIVAKAGRIGKINTALLEKSDLDLVKKLLSFADRIDISITDSSPHHIAQYLLELANIANTYYEKTPIIKDEVKERKNARLTLIKDILHIMELGSKILGIKMIERI